MILVDLPNKLIPDTDEWKDRRKITGEWFSQLREGTEKTAFTSVNLCCYENVGSSNNELPNAVVLTDDANREMSLNEGSVVPLEEILKSSFVVIALTQFSATAPLKILARNIVLEGLHYLDLVGK